MKRIGLLLVAILCCLGVAWAGPAKPLPTLNTQYLYPLPQKEDGSICVTLSAINANHKRIVIKTGTITGLAPGAPEFQKQAAVNTWLEQARNEYNAKVAAGTIEKKQTTEFWCEGSRQGKRPRTEECGGGDCYARSLPGKIVEPLHGCFSCVCPYNCVDVIWCCPGYSGCNIQCSPCP